MKHSMSMLLRYQIAPYAGLPLKCTEQECKTDSGMCAVLIQTLDARITLAYRQEKMTEMQQMIGLITAERRMPQSKRPIIDKEVDSYTSNILVSPA